MQNGVERHDRDPGEPLRSWVKDTVDAVLFAEGIVAQRRFLAPGYARPLDPAQNAFGDSLGEDRGAPDIDAVVERFAAAAAAGTRVALISPARALLSSRERLGDIARRRLGTVVHLVVERSVADALAFADLGWGMLFASSLEDSFDLALVARRAAEDCGTPFFVVHEAHAQVRHVESVGISSAELARVFVGPAEGRLRSEKDAAHPAHAAIGERAFLERVPFALASAMRELESLAGRRHDLVERLPSTDCALVLVGLGELGESLLAQAERLRDAGHDVGAVKLTALRPFPGVRLVKMLARAQVITVVEAVDEPLAQSNPLTREIKAAFADAITWAPEYPGVGRVPRIFSGYVGPGSRELDGADADAIVANMTDGDRERRTFVLGGLAQGDGEHDGKLPQAKAPASMTLPPGAFSLRVRAASPERGEAIADLCTRIVMGTLGLRTRATVRPVKDAGAEEVMVDLFAARERPRGIHPPHAVRLIIMDSVASLLQGHPLARLGMRGALAIPSAATSPEGVWSELPAYAKALAFDRHARVFGFRPATDEDATADKAIEPWFHAARVAGVAVGTAGAPGRPVLDPSRLARDVEAVLVKALGPSQVEAARRGGAIARAAMESIVEVPRAILERDEDSIRLGRRDTRASERAR
jgi:pyruvate/2-oxoacid:ferredoxin oxidoreductase alpha subunit